MSITLYQLSEEYQSLVNLIESEDSAGDFLVPALQEISDQIEAKARNIGAMVINFTSTVNAIKAEEKRLAEKRKVLENAIARIKEYALNAMIESGKQEISSPAYKLSIRTNPPSVHVFDESAVPASFIRIIPEQHTVNKEAIIAQWKKTHEAVDGCEIISDKKRLDIS